MCRLLDCVTYQYVKACVLNLRGHDIFWRRGRNMAAGTLRRVDEFDGTNDDWLQYVETPGALLRGQRHRRRRQETCCPAYSRGSSDLQDSSQHCLSEEAGREDICGARCGLVEALQAYSLGNGRSFILVYGRQGNRSLPTSPNFVRWRNTATSARHWTTCFEIAL